MPGWTSLMVVVCLSNAALMIAVGLLGEYVAKIFEEGKDRPPYVVAHTWNLYKPMAFVDMQISASTTSAGNALVSVAGFSGQRPTMTRLGNPPRPGDGETLSRSR